MILRPGGEHRNPDPRFRVSPKYLKKTATDGVWPALLSGETGDPPRSPCVSIPFGKVLPVQPVNQTFRSMSDPEFRDPTVFLKW